MKISNKTASVLAIACVQSSHSAFIKNVLPTSQKLSARADFTPSLLSSAHDRNVAFLDHIGLFATRLSANQADHDEDISGEFNLSRPKEFLRNYFIDVDETKLKQGLVPDTVKFHGSISVKQTVIKKPDQPLEGHLAEVSAQFQDRDERLRDLFPVFAVLFESMGELEVKPHYDTLGLYGVPELSSLVYLNDIPMEMGGTFVFPEHKCLVQPQQNLAISFRNYPPGDDPQLLAPHFVKPFDPKATGMVRKVLAIFWSRESELRPVELEKSPLLQAAFEGNQRLHESNETIDTSDFEFLPPLK